MALAAEGYVHDLGIGGRFTIRELYALLEPLGLTTVEIISTERDVQAGESGLIIAQVQAVKTGAA